VVDVAKMTTITKIEEDLPEVELLIIYYPENGKESWFEEAVESTKSHPVDLKIYRGNCLGPLHLRQEFISKCKTPYLAWIDDDDVLLPGTVQRCLDFLEKEENKKCCGVFTSAFLLDDDSRELRIPNNSERIFSRDSHLQREFRPHHFMLFRKEAAMRSLEIPAKFHAVRQMDLYLTTAYASLFGPWQFLDFPGYVKRNRLNSAGKNIPAEFFSLTTAHCASIINKGRKND
jgi:hypothetical protein